MTQYDAIYQDTGKPFKVDFCLWLIPFILSGIGILMVTSTTSNFVYDASGSPFAMGIRQLVYLCVGFAVMLMSALLPVKFWRNVAAFLWALTIILLAVTLIPGIGSEGGGASRWLRLGGISVQPSEIMILAVVLETGRIFEKHRYDSWKCFIAVLILIGVTSMPLLMQPDLGSTVFMVLVCMGMFVERFGWKYPLTAGLAGAAFLVLLVFAEPYRMRRLNAFRDPYADPLDSGFQTIQGLIAFANGGVWGTGLGHGFQKLQYLPAAYTDFIYAAMGEELGLPGTLGTLALMACWMFRCRSVYKRAANGCEASLAWGMTLTILLPFCINIAGVTNLMPLTGMPLPFVSYGGSSLVMSWARIGILMRLQKDASRGASS